MRYRELTDDVMQMMDGLSPAEVVPLLEKFAPNECWRTAYKSYRNPNDTSKMMGYVEALRQEGLDIGKGNSAFGYRMPIPDKNSDTRYLEIFRR